MCFTIQLRGKPRENLKHKNLPIIYSLYAISNARRYCSFFRLGSTLVKLNARLSFEMQMCFQNLDPLLPFIFSILWPHRNRIQRFCIITFENLQNNLRIFCNNGMKLGLYLYVWTLMIQICQFGCDFTHLSYKSSYKERSNNKNILIDHFIILNIFSF